MRRRSHPRTRAKSRYGVNLSPAAMNTIAALVRAGQAQYLGDVTNSKRLYAIRYRGQKMRVLYSVKQERIITFLPLEEQ